MFVFLQLQYIILSNHFYREVLRRRWNYKLVLLLDKNNYCYQVTMGDELTGEQP
jgi:hypothetical protein